MKYNTEEKRLALPEYGRNIQNMVDYCITIADREERKRCANTIINVMGNLFPHLRDVNDFKHILWDHLAIMSDFKLDIDYPYEIVKKENLNTRPPRIPYSNSRFHYRHYGKTLELMIQKATTYPDGPEKDQLIKLLATQMKKSFLTWNKETVDDRKIFKVEVGSEPVTGQRIEELRQKLLRRFPALSAEEADFFYDVPGIERNMYNLEDDHIEILYKDGTTRDIAEASDMFNWDVLSKKTKKYFLCYLRTE